ncbi:hypothetical protein HZ994_11585 [Akkermansiaceae bacterium]|nr:hypothetical protein HZ994_11585 [Akkermansiaceae bacterium]
MAKDVISCKLTGDVGPGVKAHIVPKAFHGLKDENGKVRQGGVQFIYDGKALHENKRPKGIYDPTIVTQKGEEEFKSCDDYAARFFLQEYDQKPWKPYPISGNLQILPAGEFNANLIRRFCMTVLWRAHASSQPFYGEVDLGVHEERLRKLILADDVGDPGDFSVILWDWQGVDRRKWPLEMPSKHRLGGGVNFYEFRSAGVNFSIKVDGRKIINDPSIVGMGSDLRVFLKKRSGGSAMTREFLRQINDRYQLKAL